MAAVTRRFACFALCAFATLGFGSGTPVTVGCGQYLGVQTPNGITQWLGLRYAAPPVGELRFAAPRDAPCIRGLHIADKRGPGCVSTNVPLIDTMSEDCLFLDVYAPSNATRDSKLPVFFWIEGGGFNSSPTISRNGSGLVQASSYSIIVVVFTYRVGPYGFITNGGSITANNGLRDQRKALEWIQEHISGFGGDPHHVVLGGSSAGGASITLQMAAYGGRDHRGLFHAAAAESASFAPVLTVRQSQYQYDNLAIQLGCVKPDSMACLRSKTTAELQAHNTNNFPYPGAGGGPIYMWGPVVDGDFLTDVTFSLFERGQFVAVPTIFGDDTNGGTTFTPRTAKSLGESDGFLHNQFAQLTLSQLARINDLYPNRNLSSCPAEGCYWRQVSDAYGDLRFMCPNMYMSSAVLTRHGPSRSWNYRYDVEDPAQVAAGLGVPHTVEAHAIFGPTNTVGAPASYFGNGTNAPVVPVIQAYWTSFIRSFDPNTHRLPSSAAWRPWTADGQNRLLFQTGGKTTMESLDETTRRRCRYLTEIGVSILQ